MLYQKLTLVCLLGISNIVLAGRTEEKYTREGLRDSLWQTQRQDMQDFLNERSRIHRQELMRQIAFVAAGTVGVAGLLALQQQRQNNNQPCTIL